MTGSYHTTLLWCVRIEKSWHMTHKCRRPGYLSIFMNFQSIWSIIRISIDKGNARCGEIYFTIVIIIATVALVINYGITRYMLSCGMDNGTIWSRIIPVIVALLCGSNPVVYWQLLWTHKYNATKRISVASWSHQVHVRMLYYVRRHDYWHEWNLCIILVWAIVLWLNRMFCGIWKIIKVYDRQLTRLVILYDTYCDFMHHFNFVYVVLSSEVPRRFQSTISYPLMPWFLTSSGYRQEWFLNWKISPSAVSSYTMGYNRVSVFL